MSGTTRSFAAQHLGLVCVFNALHEWGDPVASARHIRHALAADGICQPAGDGQDAPESVDVERSARRAA